MPYYRILIYTTERKKPYTGIRLISDANINSVQSKAKQTYKQKFIEVEVQMLSKLCRAVKEYIKVG